MRSRITTYVQKAISTTTDRAGQIRHAIGELINPASKPPAADGRLTLEQQLRQSNMPIAEPRIRTPREAERDLERKVRRITQTTRLLSEDKNLERAVAEDLLDQGRIADSAYVSRYGLVEARRRIDQERESIDRSSGEKK